MESGIKVMQLVAYGAQDVFLTGNPKVTFFQAVYKRHTNFAMETIEQTVNGSATSSGRVSVTVARNGDLIGEMFMELSANAAAVGGFNAANGDLSWVAERAIEDIELSIGGQRIDKHYQRWWRLYSELYLDESKKVNYGKMVTNPTEVQHDVYLPLVFFFNRNPGLYLPLIALQYHEVRLDFDLKANYSDYFNGLKVWGNYVYLDTEERRRFAQKGHEYLIEQVQHTGNDTLGAAGSNKQVRLSYNHPIKELVWCVTGAQSTSTKALWNLTESTAAVARPEADGSSVPTTWGSGCPMITTSPPTEEANGSMSSFKLILNGQDRFKEQDGKYFNQVQPYYHHSGCPMPGVYSYSFALKPEEHQPTGTCNFSRIDNAQVDIVPVSGDRTLEMFAVNYNVLRIQSGMGGLSFAS